MPQPEYSYYDERPTWGSDYLWPVVCDVIRSRRLSSNRAFELGCGNGATSNMLTDFGFEMTAVDPSASGIAIAKKVFTRCTFSCASGYDDLSGRFGQFELVLCLEVLQHCSNPKMIAQTLFDLVEPGGIAVISVTFHSYVKYLALALAGRLDGHLNALWETGPLKFFSVKTLRSLLLNVGFRRIEFRMAGRIPIFAKSMVAIAFKEDEELNKQMLAR